MRKRNGWLGMVAVGLLAACGGGGGGSGTAPAAAPAVIDAASAPVIARQVIDVGFGATAFGAVLGGSGLISAGGGSNALAQDLGRRQALAAGNAAPSATLAPETFDCLVGGTVRLSGTLASDATLTAGDRLSASFTACDDGDGAVYDGRLQITVSDFSGDLLAGSYFLAAGATLTGLRITADGSATSATGDMDLELDTRLPDQPILAASGQRLAVSADAGSWVLSDYAFTVIQEPAGDPAGGLVSRSAAGTLEGPGYSGAVDFLTVVPLATGADGLPVAGEVLITGAGGASIRVTAPGGDTLLLAIDLDGDGQVDQTQDLAWVP